MGILILMLTLSEIEKLDKLAIGFQNQRSKGLTANYLANKSEVSLKDVMSYLIEKEILVGEQIDLELLRVLFEKNEALRNKTCQHLGISYDILDELLVTEKPSLKNDLWGLHQRKKIPLYLSGVMFSINPLVLSSVLTLISYLIAIICAINIYLAFNEPSTTLNAILRIMEEM